MRFISVSCKYVLSSALLIYACSTVARAGDAPPPPVMLANVYSAKAPIDLKDYWASEKLDGVRGYWDGHKLISRGGNVIHAPAWFTAHWPEQALDGELWAGRGRFEQASAAVRTETPDDAAWRQMHYEVFDLPSHAGPFDERLAALKQLLAGVDNPSLQLVEQFKLTTPAALQTKLKEITDAGGEGLVLHKGSALYRAGRSDDLLKLKLHDDAEARVVAYIPGTGKYTGLLGALEVQRADGVRFRIGTGFSDEQRRHPPPIGAQITYIYNGYTRLGVPRFARFVRVRDDEPQRIPAGKP